MAVGSGSSICYRPETMTRTSTASNAQGVAAAHRATRLGIAFMLLAILMFALNDTLGKWLLGTYAVGQLLFIRTFSALAVMTPIIMRVGWRTLFPTHQRGLLAARAVIATAEIGAFYVAVSYLPLADTITYWMAAPIYVAALSPLLLGEHVGWRRWTAIGIGFVGILIILRPGFAVFSPLAIVPLVSAFMFALYGLLTRYVARKDSPWVSFFWTGVAGAVAITPLGLWHWQPMTAPDWGWMALLCLTAASAHFLMIKALAVAEASAIQPFAYLQLVFIAILGVTVFGETLRPNVIAGAVIVVGAGLFTLWRARVKGA